VQVALLRAMEWIQNHRQLMFPSGYVAMLHLESTWVSGCSGISVASGFLTQIMALKRTATNLPSQLLLLVLIGLPSEFFSFNRIYIYTELNHLLSLLS
jgi:hypothetical protein